MTDPTTTESDPVATWASAAPRTPSQPEPAAEPIAVSWRWGWSPWIGIHYGPVPVGLIIGIPILIALGVR